MKASDAKKFIGKEVEYIMNGWGYRPRTGIVEETFGRNILIDGDWRWAADIKSMELVNKKEEE